MKTIPLLTALTLLATTSVTFAGQEISSSKEMKQTVLEEPLFKDRELQTGTFAVYQVGNGPSHAGPFRDHAWGSGSEVNFFFTKYIGIGAEYFGTYGTESPDTNRGEFTDHRVSLNHVGGNLFFRLPLEEIHLAPYVYVGGGADFGDRSWGSAHAGAGFEYRIKQHFLPIVAERMGFFVDGRWTYLGDRYFGDTDTSRGDLNYFTVRAGFRFSY